MNPEPGVSAGHVLLGVLVATHIVTLAVAGVAIRGAVAAAGALSRSRR